MAKKKVVVNKMMVKRSESKFLIKLLLNSVASIV